MYRGIKYSFDVAITLAGSIVLLPLSALVALSLCLRRRMCCSGSVALACMENRSFSISSAP